MGKIVSAVGGDVLAHDLWLNRNDAIILRRFIACDFILKCITIYFILFNENL